MPYQILDALLALCHYLVAFALVMVLFGQWLLLGMPAERRTITLLARLDVGYGLLAAAMLVAGGARVLWGAKGWNYYADNTTFWLKTGCFSLIGLWSVLPTLRIRQWHRNVQLPSADSMARLRRWKSVELGLLFPLLLLASLMARGIGH